MLGQTLNNRYEITARIGAGAMGDVYRATDAQTGQTVAVKVLARQLAVNEEMVERFRREGNALRQLRHPNIVEFIDTFQHAPDPSGGAGGQQVIVMEFVPGGSLHELIQQGPLPIERAREIALDLCDALIRAHRLGIVHRDIKPENIMLAEDGTPRLTDFGVARLVGEGTRLTGTGMQVGTPYYMPPEAWEGNPLDAQADIWALGVVLYEMLTGEVPFPGETLIAVMNKVLNAPLPEIQTLRADVSEGLAQIVARMLTRDRVERYQSMRMVAAELERGQPVAEAQPRGLKREELAKEEPRHPSPLLLAGVGVLVAALVGAVALVGPRLFGTAEPVGENVGTELAGNLTGPRLTATLDQQDVEPIDTEVSLTPILTITHAPTVTSVPSLAERAIAAIGDRPPDFEDDFSTLDSGWFTDSSARLSVSDGRLIIENTLSQAGGGTFHRDVAYTDFMIQADVTLLKNTPGGSFGLWWRAPVGAGGCFLDLSPGPSEGPTSFSLHCDGGVNQAGVLSSVDTTVDAPNLLALVVVGDEMTALINGEEIATITDPTWQTGFIGFLANSVSETGTTIAVDSVRVWDLTRLDLDGGSAGAEQTRPLEEPTLAATLTNTPMITLIPTNTQIPRPTVPPTAASGTANITLSNSCGGGVFVHFAGAASYDHYVPGTGETGGAPGEITVEVVSGVYDLVTTYTCSDGSQVIEGTAYGVSIPPLDTFSGCPPITFCPDQQP